MKVICINDKDRPSLIPVSQWIKEGEWYTVTKTMKCNVQGGLLGFKLAEVSLNGCDPYYYYAANRFGIPVEQPDDELVEELEIA